MANDSSDLQNLQSILTDEFFYFFFSLRKSRIRKVVEAIQDRFSGESPEQLSRRLISAQSQLTFLSGALMHLPTLIPGVGQILQSLDFVVGASILTRMHLYLILEIALLYGKDIDDQARVPEMAAVVAATLMAAGVPVILGLVKLHPLLSLPAAGLTASAITTLIGEGAIRLYRDSLETEAAAASLPAESMG